MRPVFVIIALLILAVTSFGQFPKKAMKKMGLNPVVFVDSLDVDMDSLRALNPFDISNISIVKPKRAKRLIGDRGIDGAIYITTVKSAKQIYWTFFKAKSEAYKQLLNSPQADTIVQYVLNGQLLSDRAAPGELFLITDRNFRYIEVIEKEKPLNDNVLSKRYLVVIKATHPKGLVKTSNMN
jgi:hypothetical protein